MATCLLCLTSCDSSDMSLTYNMDNNTLLIDIPHSWVSDDYISVAAGAEMISTLPADENLAHIVIDFTTYEADNAEQWMNKVKDTLKKMIPLTNGVIDSFTIQIERNYFGSSLSGTQYYTISIQSDSTVKFDIAFVSTSPFMLNTQNATKKDALYILNAELQSTPEVNTYELEQRLLTFSSMNMYIDVSTPEPSVRYSMSHNLDDTNSLRLELESMGMTVEYCDYQQVTFYEKFDTSNDFQYVFPIRTFAIFGIVSTVEYSHGAFFTSDGVFNIEFFDIPENLIVNVTIASQESTSFVLKYGDKTLTTKDTYISFDAASGTSVHAEYSNVRWFQSITSMLVVIAIMFAVAGMIYIARRKIGG